MHGHGRSSYGTAASLFVQICIYSFSELLYWKIKRKIKKKKKKKKKKRKSKVRERIKRKKSWRRIVHRNIPKKTAMMVPTWTFAVDSSDILCSILIYWLQLNIYNEYKAETPTLIWFECLSIAAEWNLGWIFVFVALKQPSIIFTRPGASFRILLNRKWSFMFLFIFMIIHLYNKMSVRIRQW